MIDVKNQKELTAALKKNEDIRILGEWSGDIEIPEGAKIQSLKNEARIKGWISNYGTVTGGIRNSCTGTAGGIYNSGTVTGRISNYGTVTGGISNSGTVAGGIYNSGTGTVGWIYNYGTVTGGIHNSGTVTKWFLEDGEVSESKFAASINSANKPESTMPLVPDLDEFKRLSELGYRRVEKVTIEYIIEAERR